jgi:DNA-binding NtrC family response regulator
VQHFLNKYSRETTKRVDHISRGALQLLENYDWPGNVRELENAMERAVVLSRSRSLDVEDFSFIRPPAASSSLPQNLSLREMEKQYILRTLEENDWNITRTAGVLEINRVTLHKKIKTLKLRPDQT